MILKKLELGMFASNCYILVSESTKEGLIIDAGDEPNTILNTVKSLGLSIKLILITHGHLDHISGINKVREVTKAEVGIHAGDAGLLKGGRDRLMGIPLPVVQPPDKLLKDGDVIDVADIHLEVLYTPGHSAGGVCFLGKGIVFTGDTLFYQSVGRTDLGGSHQQLINSIVTRLMPLPDNTIVYPGHGPETTIGEERSHNPFLHGDF